MPHGVAVGQTFPGKKDDAKGIEQAAGHKPEHAGRGHVREHRFGRDDDQPPHDDINRGGQIFKMVDEPEFQQYSRER